MGYDLNEGSFEKRPLSKEEMWKTINWLFSNNSINETSYKFLLFKSLIDCCCLRSTIGKLSFDIIFSRFTEISWNIILKYGVRQKSLTINLKKSVLEQILHEYAMISLDNEYVAWHNIEKNDRIRLCKNITTKCKRYVVGALFSDMNALFFSFDKKEEWIELNPIMVKFINDNKALIENLNYYKWAKFYITINDPEIEKNFSFLADNDFIRRNESTYRAMLAYEFERNKQNEFETIKLPNTFELLCAAENQSVYFEKNEISNKIEDAYENEMYESYEKMQVYLNDPLLLICKLKKKLKA
ncbi:MAG: hypothetical protein WCI30_05090 [Clostridia bacterium]